MELGSEANSKDRVSQPAHQHHSITVSSPEPNTDKGHLRTNNLGSPETLRMTPCTWKILFVIIVPVLFLVLRLEPRAPDMLRKYFATEPHPMLNSEKNIFNSQALLLKPRCQHYSTKPGHTNCLEGLVDTDAGFACHKDLTTNGKFCFLTCEAQTRCDPTECRDMNFVPNRFVCHKL